MEIFALESDVALLEQRLHAQGDAGHLPTMLSLAWHLRQRDTRRALAIVEDIERRAAAGLGEDTSTAQIVARCGLIRAESKWLFGELDCALELTKRALARFASLGDKVGTADAHWLVAMIAHDRGDGPGRDAELEIAIADAREANDAVRILLSDATMAVRAIYRDPRAAEGKWGERFKSGLGCGHPGVVSWIDEFWGLLAYQTSDIALSASRLIPCFEAALATGQFRRSIALATNIGACFSSLNDHHAALAWMQKGLDLARSVGWPVSVGMALMQTGETLRLLGRLEAAQELLDEALATLSSLAGRRTFAIALNYLGDLALDRQDYAAAREFFAQLKERSDALSHPDLQTIALRGQAHALVHLGKPDEALEIARAALTLARKLGGGLNEFTALRVLAEIHAMHPALHKGAAGSQSEALRLLRSALDIAGTIEGYTIPADLFNSMAEEYSKLNDFPHAYQCALRAGEAREKTHSQETTNRIIAMQVMHQTEGERARSEHLTKLALSEAKRAEDLENTSATLERLGAIGQEITAHLDESAVFNVLHRQVNGLLKVTSLSIFLVEADGKTLRLAFGMEAGRPLPEARLQIDDPNAISARCVRERRELCIDVEPNAEDPNLLPGTLPTLSRLFAPLMASNQILGVMSVQSLVPSAYGEREKLIFRTLCAYGAIALDNAGAYRRLAATLKTLRDTQNLVVQQNLELEKVNNSLKDASFTDPLTGLRNRRFLIEHIETDVALALRRHDLWLASGADRIARDKDLLFFMVDLDHFKDVNDRFGHVAGDSVLMQMKNRLLEVVRESDYVVRWGGEEFLVVGRATNAREAESVAARLCDIVSSRPFTLPDGSVITKTCSVGFAGFPFLSSAPRQLSWLQTIELADRALYLVKERGRNGWIGVQATDCAHDGAWFGRVRQDMTKASDAGLLRLVSSSLPATAATGMGGLARLAECR